MPPGDRIIPEHEVREYFVRLNAEERQTLETVIRKGTHPASLTLKARIPLKADISEAGEGWSDNRIVRGPGYQPHNVHRTRQRLVEEAFDAVLRRKPRERPSIPRIFDGEKEARLVALACSKPPKGMRNGACVCWKKRSWNCYYKPTGPKIVRAGWVQLETMVAGFKIAANLKAESNVRIP